MPEPSLHERLQVVAATLSDIRRTLRAISDKLDGIEQELVAIRVPDEATRTRSEAS